MSMNRRELLALATAGATLNLAPRAFAAPAAESAERRFKLGLVTYNLAPDWDLQAIIDRCRAAKIEGVEFRTTHKHGVEPTLTREQREEVRKRCADGGLVIWGLGSVCDFHSPDPAVVQKNIETCHEFSQLAHDIGARGVKVRPNGLPKEVEEARTLEQIGKAIRKCAERAHDLGVEIWCEVHGHETSDPARMRTIMDHADHPAAGVTWNSNGSDLKNGSVKEGFELLAKYIKSCHINDLTSGYPYRELFTLLRGIGYDRYTLIEHQAFATKDPNDLVRILRYYRALWNELSSPKA
jgi:sugar phosphate isomerase/epimerase